MKVSSISSISSAASSVSSSTDTMLKLMAHLERLEVETCEAKARAIFLLTNASTESFFDWKDKKPSYAERLEMQSFKTIRRESHAVILQCGRVRKTSLDKNHAEVEKLREMYRELCLSFENFCLEVCPELLDRAEFAL
ncbi:MAG TPA: hypothetical protein VKZ53_18445 [Candidatus Angelobacter sp.]|nr:hypothetical protein [Candidatus Angelobacter sp.]